MAIFSHYTPLVEPLSLDEAFLDVSGSHRLFGTSAEIGHEIKRHIGQELGLVASVGIAPTKFVAKIASDIEKPDGFVVVNEDDVLDFLRPISARKIWGVGKTTWKKLEKLGLKTIGDIACFPVEELERIFGKHGRHLYNLSRGIDDRSVESSTDRKQVSNEYTFNVDTDDMEEVERVLLALSDKVAGRLFEKELKGRTVTLKLRDETFKTITRSRTLNHPILSGEEIYIETRDLLRTENLKDRKVRLVGVSVSGFGSSRQASLFEDDSERKNRVEEILADIRGRFGKKAITRASLIQKSGKKKNTADDAEREK